MPDNIPETPKTRAEQYLAAANGQDVELPTPKTREEQYLKAIAEAMQGGGSSVTVEPLSVTENGTTTAPEGKAYSPVTVNVPNSYTAADEGKVVSNGALVAQTSDTVTQNGEVDTTLINSLTVNVSSGGGGGAEQKDVNFVDYDGTILYSYTPAEFAALTALPENPSHEGLTAQGWNWTMEKAQAYVAKYGKLWVGQMCITDDGKTRIYIHLEKGRTSPYLGIAVNGTAVVDWGDGAAMDTVTGTSTATVISTLHDYPDATADYVITIDVTGSLGLIGNSTAGSRLLWKNNTSTNPNKVYQNAVQRVEIGSNTTIGSSAFNSCHSLTAITIPDNVTSIESYAFNNCHSLTSIAIPDSVTNIGDFAFYGCHSLTAITIPDNVTSIGGGAFNSCHSLTAITIPDNVTSIGGSAFANCYSLTSVTIPDNVTSIGGSAFQYCNGLGHIRFKPTTPPTVAASNAFSGLPTDCIIYVPAGSLGAYTSATNYPSSSTYTYVEY